MNLDDIKNEFSRLNQDYGFVKNGLIVLSLMSAYYAAFISAFDYRALIFVDSTSAAKHFLGMIFLYVFISSFFKILINILERTHSANVAVIDQMAESKSHLGSKSNFVKKVLFTLGSLTIFTFVHIGVPNTVYILFSLALVWGVFYLIIFVTIYIINTVRRLKNASPKSSNYSKHIDNPIYAYVKNDIIFIALLFAMGLGFGRADQIKDSDVMNVNNEGRDVTLFMSTSSGPVFYDLENTKVEFKSWDQLKSITYKNSSNMPPFIAELRWLEYLRWQLQKFYKYLGKS